MDASSGRQGVPVAAGPLLKRSVRRGRRGLSERGRRVWRDGRQWCRPRSERSRKPLPAASVTGPFSRMIMLSVRIPRGLLYFSALSPSSSGLGRRPFKAKIAGSNPAGGTTEAPARSSLGRPGFSHAVRRGSNREVARLSKRVQAFASERARARSARSCGCRRQARTPLGAPSKFRPGLPLGGRAFFCRDAGVRTERSRVPGALFAEARFFYRIGARN